MDTDYDRIAEQYQRARLQPWRTHIERYTLLRLAGDVAGKAAIDLACGEGYYTRALRQQGAARIVGVDLSQVMIGLAEAEEGATAAGRRVPRGGCPDAGGARRVRLRLRGVPARNYARLGRGAGANVPGGGPRAEARRAFRDGQQ